LNDADVKELGVYQLFSMTVTYLHFIYIETFS